MASPIERFRRAMRRYARRADRCGLHDYATAFRLWARRGTWPTEHMNLNARGMRAGIGWSGSKVRTVAFLYERAGEAMARLQAEMAR